MYVENVATPNIKLLIQSVFGVLFQWHINTNIMTDLQLKEKKLICVKRRVEAN